MPTVTSENKAEHDREFMDKKSNSLMKDPANYKSFARDALAQSKKAATSMEHYEAMRSHKNAAIYAHPHPVSKEHEEKTAFHEAEYKKMKRVEQREALKSREKTASELNRKQNVRSGIVAGSDYEKGKR
jgi:hypothetical protein